MDAWLTYILVPLSPLLIMIGYFQKDLRREFYRLRVASWPRVPALITESQVWRVKLEGENNTEGGSVLRCRYQYVVNGQRHTGSSVSPLIDEFVDGNDAQFWAEALIEGRKVMAYVNPYDPDVAFLLPGRELMGWGYVIITLLSGVVFPVLGLYFGYACLTETPAAFRGNWTAFLIVIGLETLMLIAWFRVRGQAKGAVTPAYLE